MLSLLLVSWSEESVRRKCSGLAFGAIKAKFYSQKRGSRVSFARTPELEQFFAPTKSADANIAAIA
jgi:hypothetical protein